MTIGNNLGDMLLEMRNPATSPQRVDEIVRLVNEAGSNLETLSGWIDKLKNPVLNSPTVSNPVFLTNALSLLTLTRTTDVAIVTDTDTPISWETSQNSGTAFELDPADPTKINIIYPGQAFGILGKVHWEANATGYRNVKVTGYDASDNPIASDALQSSLGFTGLDNIFPFQLTLGQNVLPNMKSIAITVAHGRGSDLNLINAGLGIFVL